MSTERGELPARWVIGQLPKMRQQLRRLGIRASDVDDVVGTVLLAIVVSWQSYDPSRGPLAFWFWTVVRYQASHHRERAHVRREQFGVDFDCIETGVAPPDARTELAHAAALLTPTEQALVFGMAVGRSMPSLCTEVGVPQSSSYKLFHEAQAKLRGAA